MVSIRHGIVHVERTRESQSWYFRSHGSRSYTSLGRFLASSVPCCDEGALLGGLTPVLNSRDGNADEGADLGPDKMSKLNPVPFKESATPAVISPGPT